MNGLVKGWSLFNCGFFDVCVDKVLSFLELRYCGEFVYYKSTTFDCALEALTAVKIVTKKCINPVH
jgi:hypothetical protein